MEISSHTSGFVLNIETGELRYQNKTGMLKLTGIPFMITENTSRFLEVHYKDHIDCFRISHSNVVHIKTEILDDPTYLGFCIKGLGSISYHRNGNDLICDEYVNTDFFLRCKLFLYITSPCFDVFDPEVYNSETYNRDYAPHYVDLDGNIHGRDPKFVTKTEKWRGTILYDEYICIFDEYNKVGIICGPNLDQVYEQVCQLDIDHIEIYPDVCQIFTPDGDYILDIYGLTKNKNLQIVTCKVCTTKNARSNLE